MTYRGEELPCITGYQPVPNRSHGQVARVTGTLALGIVLIGCQPKSPPPPSGSYFGPTESMRDVVTAINRNNAPLATLWSRGYFEANIIEPKSNRRHFLNGDVLLLYRRDNDFRLVGKKDIAGTVFDIGSNPDRYWLILHGDADTMWWGTHANSHRVDPKTMPIQPALMLEVLGIGAMDTNFGEPPVPIMRFNNDVDAYMFVWNVPLADRWAAQKEVWFDRTTKLPQKVLLFDENGRVVLRADLSKHVPVNVESVAEDDRPKVATHYRLYFPDTGTSVSLELEEPRLRNSGAPNDRSFAFPGDNAGVATIIGVDEHATQP